MSTKIYNGYCLPKLTLEELMQGIAAMRKAVQASMLEKQWYRQTELAVKWADRYVLGKMPTTETDKWENYSPWSRGYCITSDLFRESVKKGTREPSDDYSASLQIIPTKDNMLVLVYCDDYRDNKQPNALELITKTAWFKDGTVALKPYAFWNNSDPDEDVSELEWKKRGNDWDEALGEHGIPAICGFAVQLCLDHILPLEVANLQDKYIPALADRAEEWASDELATKYLKEHNVPGEDVNWSTIRESFDFQKTEEGKKQLSALTAEYVAKLKDVDMRKQLLTRMVLQK